MDIQKHLPAILSGTACIGTGVTGYFSAKLGMQIEAEKENLKSEDSEIRKGAKWRIAFKAAPVIFTFAITEACVIASEVMNAKKIDNLGRRLAETSATLAAEMKLFNEYRKHVDPEDDKVIMNSIDPETVKVNSGLEWFEDSYISELSNGKVTGYFATEADVFCAANYLINHYASDGYADISLFYESLRTRGVDIDIYKGEHSITWESSPERWDYYGRGGIDFCISVENADDGTETKHLVFDEDDDQIHKANEELFGWCDRLSSPN